MTTGSFVVDLGGAYERGTPVRSLYNFRVPIHFCDQLGFFLAEDFYWFNPSKLPSPIEWVNKRKLRAKDSINTVWWFSKTEWPKADIRNVRTEYSQRMKKLLENPEAFYTSERPAVRALDQPRLRHRQRRRYPLESDRDSEFRVWRRLPQLLQGSEHKAPPRALPKAPARVLHPVPDRDERPRGGHLRRVQHDRRRRRGAGQEMARLRKRPRVRGDVRLPVHRQPAPAANGRTSRVRQGPGRRPGCNRNRRPNKPLLNPTRRARKPSNQVAMRHNQEQARLAERLAREAHAAQVDKANRPYTEHLQRVAAHAANDGELAVACAARHHRGHILGRSGARCSRNRRRNHRRRRPPEPQTRRDVRSIHRPDPPRAEANARWP